MTQKEAALAAASEVFKANMVTLFKVLDDNLTAARGDQAKIDAAMDAAKAGLESAQRTMAACMEIANTLA